ncbi:sensor histidine kinase [Mucilaginibacter jinjuensis]|uniref:histidine kinase n=1 Tax=Mucilaginibacter jinjuensis TaxID=1176721 RepID=A0ABY7TC50_9SPHI|nr:ATP-binding protein [Mucilaginibacter jinjuensis]WCT13283.1 ATP-binding protein [Mucilaginibacter jinjuensis]
MTFEHAIYHLMPVNIRDDKTNPRYQELRVLVSTALIALPLMLLFPVFVCYLGKPIAGYVINDLLNLVILITIRFWGHYRIPMMISALTCYWIMYGLVADSGLIYSPNVAILHMYLLITIWVNKKWGWLAILGNLGLLGFLYYQTLHAGLPATVSSVSGGPLYSLGMNGLITLFLGGFLAYLQADQEKNRLQLKALQDQKISLLDKTVKQRTEQLNSMRETIATDFHDETGNMLSAITRQASLLKLKLEQNSEVQPIVTSIIQNSNGLYASSKDFLWHLNHDSDDSQELFGYLTSYGQRYYNQFDIAFSSKAEDDHMQQLDPTAALNILFIFKEAMTNVVKHAGATEVELTMTYTPGAVTYALTDNGSWKAADEKTEHYGLVNMERRCKKNGFGFTLSKQTSGTMVAITVPVNNLNEL